MPDAPPSPSTTPPWLAERTLADGTVVRFRPVRPEDEPLISEAIHSSSRETLLHRFFSPIRSVPRELLRQMLALDATREKCIVGVVTTPDRTRIVCGARYVRLATPRTAEIAITVHDDFQHRGLGTLLLQLLTTVALHDGIGRFEADVMCSNLKMLRLLRKLFPFCRSQRQMGDVMHVTAELGENTQEPNYPNTQE